MTTRHEYEMGIIGNCNFLGYINKKANLNWLCWPRMDSSFVFGSLIDKDSGGDFFISPAQESKFVSSQHYLSNTNILITEFKNEDEHFRVIDFAPRFELYERFFKPLMVMRKVEIIKGKPEIKVRCRPKYEYGAETFTPKRGSNHIDYELDSLNMRLTTNASINYLLNEKNFYLTKDLYFCLTWEKHLEAPLEETFEEFFRKTTSYWRTWVRRTSIPTIYQDEVIRSSLALKLHQYEDTGAIIASGSTSLPEHDQSGRNWDYRYCWPRDSYYTLNAFNLISHFSELEGYSHFLQNLITHDQHVQPMFGIDGRTELVEKELDLEGYKGNKPVRIGNGAYTQVQYDVYGQILHSLAPLYFDARLTAIHGEQDLAIVETLLGKIEESMDLPDAGIWEFRNKVNHHLHTKLFHWLGSKVVIKIAKKFHKPTLLERAQKCKAKAVDYIESCWDEKNEFYRAATDFNYVDASTLLLVNLNYLDPKQDRARKHVEHIYNELQSPNGFLYRYKVKDDFGETKSSFLVCMFWYIEALIRLGDIERARTLLAKVNQASNKLGLFSEDIEGDELSQWGNFPQTYSHVGFITCAFKLEQNMNKHIFEI